MRIVAKLRGHAGERQERPASLTAGLDRADGAADHAARRRFVAIQASKALAGAVLVALFVVFVGRPDAAESVALAGLLLPAVLAALGLTRLPLPELETASLAIFAILIGYLVALTGGMRSPLLLWFVLVPAEAAIAGGRPTVTRAAIAAALALLAVAALQALGWLPVSRISLPEWQIYAVSALAAVIQSAFVATAAQDRQRAADMAAAKGAAMYRFLADNAMDLITRHGADGRIRFASPAARNLLGRAPDSLLGVAPAALVHPDDLKTMQAAFMEASYFGRAAAAEVRLRRADGSYVWTEMRCRPAAPVAGKAADIVAVTRDISERKAHERELIEARDLAEEASKAKSRFLANMSHELRTPLNAIIGFSEVMTQEMFGPVGSARYIEYARLIHESGGHLLELINGVLDMSKIEAGKFELSEEVFDLEEVAGAALGFVKLQADRKGVRCRWRCLRPAAKSSPTSARSSRSSSIFSPTASSSRRAAARSASASAAMTTASRSWSATPASAFRPTISSGWASRSSRPRASMCAPRRAPDWAWRWSRRWRRCMAARPSSSPVLGEGTAVRVRLPYAGVGEAGESAGAGPQAAPGRRRPARRGLRPPRARLCVL